MMEKILITGASGFVGKNLMEYLKKIRNQKIIRLVRNNSSKNDDLTSILFKNFFADDHYQFQTYIHLAGKAHDTDYKTKRQDFIEVNTELTKKIFDRFLRDPYAKNFIFVSSIAAIEKNSVTPIEENYKPNPYGFYGESKYLAEKYILDNLPEKRTQKVFILRPPMIHGPGNKGNLNLLYTIVKKGIPWPLGNFNNKRCFLSIENFCFIINEILDGNVSQGIYHLADDEPLSTNQIVEMISNQLGQKAKIFRIPKPVIQFGAKLGNTLPLPLNEERLQKLTDNYLVSNKKIVSELGKPLPVSAREGMQKTIQSLIKENG